MYQTCTQFNYQKNAPIPLLVPSPPESSQLPKTKIIFEISRGKLEIFQFILLDKDMDGTGQSLRHFLSKNMLEVLHNIQLEVISQ